MLAMRSEFGKTVKSPDQLCIHRMQKNYGQNRGPARTRGSTEQPCPRSNKLEANLGGEFPGCG